MTNGRQSMRAPGDPGVHNCPHCGSNATVGGSQDVKINGLMAHRLTDSETEFCGSGTTVAASEDVIVN
jgi:uncharacterized Zn-binding protein involved in type VI secretion